MNCLNKNLSDKFEIIGLKSQSASPTEQWTCKYFIDEKVICKSFLKIWVDNNSFKSEESLGLDYEGLVYEQIKAEIIDTKLSHSFVEIISFEKNKTFKDMVNMLYNGIPPNIRKKYKDDYNIITEDEIKEQLTSNLLRNTSYMIEGRKDKPMIYYISEILDETIQKLIDDIIDINYSIQYNYIETKNLDSSINFLNFYSENKSRKELIVSTINKVLEAVDIMNSKNIFNQDLHLGNILVDMEDVYIYDFDRAYSESLGNNENLNDLCEDYGSCNEVVEGKDFIQIFCNLLKIGFLTEEQFMKIVFETYNRASLFFYIKYIKPKKNCWLPREFYIGSYDILISNRKNMIKKFNSII